MQRTQNKKKIWKIIYVEKNINGDIVLMTTNSLKINTINRQVANATNMLLKNKRYLQGKMFQYVTQNINKF